MSTFSEFGLEPDVLQAITDLGYEEPTPIQAHAIPVALSGRDMIGQAQTGTGKTAAFGIPLVSKIAPSEDRIVTLIMTPTRELAIQVAEEIEKLGRTKGIRSLPIYGGQDIGRQIRGLKRRPQIIIGTPGRLLDHINRKTIRLDDVQTVVLDEADEMLDMGFMEDITSILSLVPEERQTLLFSATMPTNIQKLAQQFLKNPEHISMIPKTQTTNKNIQQFYIEVQERMKFDGLCRLLDMEPPELAIIFGRTKRRVAELSEALMKRGYAADGLHGDLSQNQRDAVMRKFRDGSIDVLVATDVAARGLDISGVTHVINFDLPQDPESYVHRIGRTGRAGKEGTSWTFVTPRETDHLHFIEKITRHRISKKALPTLSEAMEGKQRVIAERIIEAVGNEEDTNAYKWVAAQLLEQYDSVQLLAAAMKLLTGDKKDVSVELTPEDPIRSKKRGFGGRSGGYGGGGQGRGGYGRREGGGGSYGGQGRGGYGQRREGGSYNGGGERRGGYNGNGGSQGGQGGGYRKPYREGGGRREDGGGFRGDSRREESRSSRNEDYVNI
ncbi:DEAD/DEAH box helicase [Cohnella fermenti]|uniref:ATP-dependent RNA helicase CshA n=1 Tax=Cohnella fermenti TaxID=2565925 RepID=A0A4S4C892_9BACL|nr:DEAD/DEAH box helicase [Cohnella fermenti]THF83864.1 DEAD/DEAH box helicase [Cohnella fermenti]